MASIFCDKYVSFCVYVFKNVSEILDIVHFVSCIYPSMIIIYSSEPLNHFMSFFISEKWDLT